MNDSSDLIEAAKSGNIEDARSILESGEGILNQLDETGAAAMHYAAFNGHREVVRLFVQHGANINVQDGKWGATPAGWAIEYLRELGGFLGIELDDFAYAIQQRDVRWVARYLKRFPSLSRANDLNGTPFRTLAMESGNEEIIELFK